MGIYVMTPQGIKNIKEKEIEQMAWSELGETTIIGKKIQSVLYNEGRLNIILDDKTEFTINACKSEQNKDVPELEIQVYCNYEKTFRI